MLSPEDLIASSFSMPATRMAWFIKTGNPVWKQNERHISRQTFKFIFEKKQSLTDEEFSILYENGFRQFTDANLDSIHFDGRDLTGLNISQAQLHTVTLYRTTLTLAQALRVIDQNPGNNHLLRSAAIKFPTNPLKIEEFNALLNAGVYRFAGANFTEIDLRNRKDLMSISLQNATLKSIQVGGSTLTLEQALEIVAQNDKDRSILAHVAVQFPSPDEPLNNVNILRSLCAHGLRNLTGAYILNVDLSGLSLENTTLENVQLEKVTLTLDQALMFIHQNPENNGILMGITVQFPSTPLDSNSFKELYRHGLRNFSGANLTKIADQDFKGIDYQETDFANTRLTLKQASIIIIRSNNDYNKLNNAEIIFPKNYMQKKSDGSMTLRKQRRNDFDKLLPPAERSQHNITFNSETITPKKPRDWSWLKTTLAVIGVVAAVVSIAGIIPLAIYGCVKLYRSHASKKIAPIKIVEAAPSPASPPHQPDQPSTHAVVDSTLSAAGLPPPQPTDTTLPIPNLNQNAQIAAIPVESPQQTPPLSALSICALKTT